ncbi:MAG: rhomboid family intramembrane serine protease [Anaerolineae bacterium]|nr:rhomboid family intramembrane serine protease [Anaerolineae bacterium]
MIPLGTVNNPTRRTPYLTYGLILVNVLVFIWQTLTPVSQLNQTYGELAIIPCQFPANVGLDMFWIYLRGMFLHANWTHLLGNMVYLWLFGTNIEDYFGRKVFLSLYFLGAAVAGLTQTIVYAANCNPLIGIGASGAISAVLGAYLILYPGTRVRVGVIFFRVFMQTLKVPALIVLGLWFVIQLLGGFSALTAGAVGGVGFFAHIGGFIFGMVFAFIYLIFNKPPETPIYTD